jgi:RimJ/RimL family protein N-acetyltransferase
MALKVVEADAGDVGRLALVSSLAKQTYQRWAANTWRPPTPASEERRWRELLADRHGRVYIAALGEEVVGAVSITAARTDGGRGEEVPGLAHLGRMFVHPERWGQGIGSVLLLRAVAEMQQRGYRTAQLYTGAGNTRSRRFYERHGWRLSQRDAERRHEGIAVVRYTVAL